MLLPCAAAMVSRPRTRSSGSSMVRFGMTYTPILLSRRGEGYAKPTSDFQGFGKRSSSCGRTVEVLCGIDTASTLISGDFGIGTQGPGPLCLPVYNFGADHSLGSDAFLDP